MHPYITLQIIDHYQRRQPTDRPSAIGRLVALGAAIVLLLYW